jgi:hypothetical protein
MKTNGRIQELLSVACANDIEYGHRVIWPLLDYLEVPPGARRPQFQIENPFTSGLLKLDYLIHVGDIPMVTIEASLTPDNLTRVIGKRRITARTSGRASAIARCGK